MFVKKFIYEIMSWTKAIVLALVLAVALSVFVIQPFTVDGSSMEPTLEGLDHYDQQKAGDRVFAFKTPYLLGKSPKAGEIVIVDSRIDDERTLMDSFAESPMLAAFIDRQEDSRHNWVKRVIGEPGDRIAIEGGFVYKNGVRLEEEYIYESIYHDFTEVTVPDDHVFVMGDNRNRSTDSREIGPVPIDHVTGKVIARFYPFDRLGTF
ncbi:signal peptidase I [Alkalihalophilus pseudofirmus]|uniref:Signal peptidase I n=1 Tax=Alkalihalophilus pseudofirmus TaxID=79885 RepID=A0AAJ2KUZ7_ALKPS|nr:MULTISPECIES: signal peptidase I [Alkalihalophilus]MDV2883741.1 signal peptidase I [Alkalihalophilus pseudofirmus]MED1602706.1 signal peptidase I [Alkalihalophilus marmarensis]WEG17849.1 signal peptidase I [Alkalihalophilus pseudofirmus]